MSIDNKILTGLNIGGGSIEDDQWMSYEEWENAQLERVTIYFECPNGEFVQKDTVGGTFFYKS